MSDTIMLRLTRSEAAEVRNALLETRADWTNTLDRASKALDPLAMASDVFREYVGAMRAADGHE
jgi:hypothetical protein